MGIFSNAFAALIDWLVTLIDPAILLAVALDTIGRVLWGIFGLFGLEDTGVSSFITGWLSDGPLPKMFDLMFYFVSPFVYVPVVRPLVGLSIIIYPVSAAVKLAVNIKSWFWTGNT